MIHPIWVLASIVSSCALAEFSSEIVVSSGENSAASLENRSGEFSMSEHESQELLDTSQPRIEPVVSYNTPEVVQFPKFDAYSKNGEPLLKYYKRYILTPRVMNPYTMATGLKPRPFFRYGGPNSRQIKRTFMSNKPIFMPKFMYSERPEFIYNKPPPFFRPFRSLPPITAPKLNDMIISSPIRTSPEYAQMSPGKPRIPDYIYQQQAVSQSAKIPTFVRAPGAFLYAHGHHAAMPPHPRIPVAVPQQFNPVKLTQQQPQYQTTFVSSGLPTAAVPVQSSLPAPQNVLPPQALVQHKQPEYVAVSQTALQPQMVATNYQPIQYQVHDSVREGTQELPIVEQNALHKPGYVKVLVSTGEQFVTVPEPSPKYILTGQRLVYKSPQPQTVYVSHQPQYSTLIAQPPIDSTPQYVSSNQDITRYATINQPVPQGEQITLNNQYTQSYIPSSTVQNYRTAESDQLLTALRAHNVMAQYAISDDPQDIIVGTTKKEDSSEQEGSPISSSKNPGLWSTLTAAVNVSSDYDVSSGKDSSYNAIVEVPAPKLTSTGS